MPIATAAPRFTFPALTGSGGRQLDNAVEVIAELRSPQWYAWELHEAPVSLKDRVVGLLAAVRSIAMDRRAVLSVTAASALTAVGHFFFGHPATAAGFAMLSVVGAFVTRSVWTARRDSRATIP